MTTRRLLAAACTAGALLTLAACGSSYDDSRDVYEKLRVDIGCDTVDSDDFESFMEGEVADGFPAFDTVDGDCQLGDDDISVAAVVPHDVSAEEFLEAMAGEGFAGYAVHTGKWAVLMDGDDAEVKEFAAAVQDEMGGKLVTVSESGVEKV